MQAKGETLSTLLARLKPSVAAKRQFGRYYACAAMVACHRHRICDTGPSNTVAEEVGERMRIKFIDASSWQE